MSRSISASIGWAISTCSIAASRRCYVFGPKNRLITTFTIAEKDPGAFTRARALGLDAAGRLYIFDEKSKRIQVYQ